MHQLDFISNYNPRFSIIVKTDMNLKVDVTTTQKRLLAQALEKNDRVEETVKQSADNLMLVNAVLQSDVPGRAHSADVAVALIKVDEIHEVIHDSAQELAIVNGLLESEIDERIVLERELLAAKVALARAAV